MASLDEIGKRLKAFFSVPEDSMHHGDGLFTAVAYVVFRLVQVIGLSVIGIAVATMVVSALCSNFIQVLGFMAALVIFICFIYGLIVHVERHYE